MKVLHFLSWAPCDMSTILFSTVLRAYKVTDAIVMVKLIEEVTDPIQWKTIIFHRILGFWSKKQADEFENFLEFPPLLKSSWQLKKKKWISPHSPQNGALDSQLIRGEWQNYVCKFKIALFQQWHLK